MSRVATYVCLFGGVVALVAASDAKPQSAPKKLLVGDTNTEIIASYKGTDPLPKPDSVLVYDFTVPSNVIAMDESAAARLHRRRLQRQGSDEDSSPEAVAQQVQASFSKTLVSQLQKNTPVPTGMAAGRDTAVPTHALIVHGEFTAVNEGNKSKRIIVGFGRGASDVQAHVTVLLTTETQPIVLSEFILKSGSGKKPGAAATMGVGSAAAGAVSVATGTAGGKNATVEADASRMAKAVAKQIEELMLSQKWISPEQPKSK
jgi:hypothetical protein